MLPSPYGRGAGGEVRVWVKFFVFGLVFRGVGGDVVMASRVRVYRGCAKEGADTG